MCLQSLWPCVFFSQSRVYCLNSVDNANSVTTGYQEQDQETIGIVSRYPAGRRALWLQPEGGSQWSPYSTWWYLVAAILLEWAVEFQLGGRSPDSTDVALQAVSSYLPNKVARTAAGTIGVDFPDYSGRQIWIMPHTMLHWCTVFRDAGKTRAMHIGIRKRTPWLEEPWKVMVMMNIMRLRF